MGGDEKLAALRAPTSRLNDPEMQADWADKKFVWLASEHEGYVLASTVEELSDERLRLRIQESGKEVIVTKYDIQKANPPKFEKTEDMANLTMLNEAGILYNLKQRYYSNLIYTYSGMFCVVINPYKNLPIYTDAIVEKFKGKKRRDAPPHIYAVADAAYRNMLSDKEDQSILCTGESGAGKTENTKKVIQYLTSIAGHRFTGGKPGSVSSLNTSARNFANLEEQLLQANPILEAFGNSKTVKNDNSSRFGKFIKTHFDTYGLISGANIEFYLLEKSRVIRQAANERSFHIFYQLIKGADANLAEELLLEPSPKNYKFLSHGDLSIQNVNDKEEFKGLLAAFQIMGLSDDEVKSIFRVISAVLLFGNLQFSQDNAEQAMLTDDKVAQKICKLLGLPIAEFTKAFVKPKLKVGREQVVRAQTAEQAHYTAEAIAKACYERLFRWLVNRLNRSLDRTRQNAVSFIGILDIAGFEIFENNSFEQLCINYCNEKLQQLFNHHMFVQEQEEYKRENVAWEFVDFGLDLQPTIDLIDKNMGVMALLDETCLFPKADDRAFVDKLIKEHQQHIKFDVPDAKSRNDFSILHYAGRVDYSAKEWRTKNMDPLNENVVDILQRSSDQFVADMWKHAEFASLGSAEASDSIFGGRAKKGMFRTQCQLYKEQLSRLMSTLENTNPHFVRCIIPNYEKKVEFRQRYEHILCRGLIPKGFMDGKEACRRMIDHLGMDQAVIGQTKVFCKAGQLALLEEIRDQAVTSLIIAFQARCRGVLARREYCRRKDQANALSIIQRNGLVWMKLRNWHWWRLLNKVKPLVQITNSEEVLAEKEQELVVMREKLRRSELFIEEYGKKIEDLGETRVRLEQQLEEETAERAEADEERAVMVKRKMELEDELTQLAALLDKEQKKASTFESTKNLLEVQTRELLEQLDVARDSTQKLQADKSALEKRLKDFEQNNATIDETNARLLKEKRSLEVRLQELQEKLLTEEERIRNAEKLRGKEKAEAVELAQELDKEKKLRSELEGQRRSLEQELREHKETVTERIRQIEVTTSHLRSKEDELVELLKKSENDLNQIQALERDVRTLRLELAEKREELEHEKAARAKSDRMRQEIAEELENYKAELEETYDKNQLASELRQKRDDECTNLKKALDEQQAASQRALDELRTKAAKQVEDLNHELDALRRAKYTLEKARITWDSEKDGFEKEIQQLRDTKSESEKKRRATDFSYNELQRRLEEQTSKNQELTKQLTKQERENEAIDNSALIKKCALLESQLLDLQETVEDEKKSKVQLLTKLRGKQDELDTVEKALDDLQEANERLEKELAQSTIECADLQKSLQAESDKKLEDAKRKLTRELDAALDAAKEAELARDKAERAKKKMVQENEDLTNELGNVNTTIREMERQQRKQDQLLSELRRLLCVTVDRK
ncbi:unnamed protein product, partial [Mesorhabditis spiculigera]